MVLALGGDGGANHKAEIVEPIRDRGAATEVADVGERAAARQKCAVGLTRVLRIAGHLTRGVDGVADAGGAAQGSEAGHCAVAVEEDVTATAVVVDGGAG